MSSDTSTLEALVQALRRLPGVGVKSASRMAFHLLQNDREGAELLSRALHEASTRVRHCERCHTFTENAVCETCLDAGRDAARLCVVETPADQAALERTGAYKGLYYVLMGRLSPLDGIGPRDIGLQQLLERGKETPDPSGLSPSEQLVEISRRVHQMAADQYECFLKDVEPKLAEAGIHYIDCGTSGGVWGLAEGYSLMIGGDAGAVARLQPVFATLAPTPQTGWGHVGPSGAGHFAKMIHNGIEYGMMQAYAEGFAILKHKQAMDFDLGALAEIWRHGSVVRSWLLDLTADALKKNPQMDGVAPYVADSGEGRWTVAEAIDLNVSAPVITLSLLERLRSRDDDSYADKLLAAMRNEFGGHAVKQG